MIRRVRVRGLVRPWVAIFFLFHRKTLNNRSKLFLSVVKMAATVYQRDNCDVDFNVSVDITAIFV